MTNLKNEGTKTVATRMRLSKGWSIVIGLVLVAVIAGSALAFSVNAKGHTFNDTFTKWVTDSTAGVMVGVVGGDVGSGTYAGQILAMNTVDTTTTIHAIYNFNGSKHAFTADVNITQDESAGTAVITGVVTDGWLKGASVSGEYTVLKACSMDTPGNAFGTLCFQGVLHIQLPK
jgi:hypothetical protein